MAVVVPALEPVLDRHLLDTDLSETGTADELVDPLRLGERELAGLARHWRLRQPALDQHRTVRRRPRVPLRGRPGREREHARGTKHAAGLAERERRIGDEHVAEPRDDAVDARVGEVDRLHVHRSMLRACDPAAARGLDHRRREIGLDDPGDAAG